MLIILVVGERDTIRSNAIKNQGLDVHMSFCTLTLMFLCLLGD